MNKNIKKVCQTILLSAMISSSFLTNIVYAKSNNQTITKDKAGNTTVGSDKYHGSTSKSNPSNKHSNEKHTQSRPQPSEFDKAVKEQIKENFEDFDLYRDELKRNNKPNNNVISFNSDLVTVFYDPNDKGETIKTNDKLIGFYWKVTNKHTGKVKVDKRYTPVRKGKYITFYANVGEYLAIRKEIRKYDKVKKHSAIIMKKNEDGSISKEKRTISSEKIGSREYMGSTKIFNIKVTPQDCPPGTGPCPIKVRPENPTKVNTSEYLVE